MLELIGNQLRFSFPEVHKTARCAIDFMRTLRIPDDNKAYPLPAGLSRFPVDHVDDYKETVPPPWARHGGVFLPMYQSEALWLNFSGHYPCAIKVAAGKINAVSGEAWTTELSGDPQDYVVLPEQRWLDGFNVSKGFIRQFVAMPLGQGFSAEEQIMGEGEHGGLQIMAYPMRAEVYSKLFETVRHDGTVCRKKPPFYYGSMDCVDMGLAPGGLMYQEIYNDEYGLEVWDQTQASRCFIHLADSASYEAITGKQPPHKPLTSEEYQKAGIPWFDYYSDKSPVGGSKVLSGLKSVGAKMIESGKGALPHNHSVKPHKVHRLGEAEVVRQGEF